MFYLLRYAMERLRVVGIKLHAPELSNAFSFWSTTCRDARLAKMKAGT
jgi:hypothetical protein